MRPAPSEDDRIRCRFSLSLVQRAYSRTLADEQHANTHRDLTAPVVSFAAEELRLRYIGVEDAGDASTGPGDAEGLKSETERRLMTACSSAAFSIGDVSGLKYGCRDCACGRTSMDTVCERDGRDVCPVHPADRPHVNVLIYCFGRRLKRKKSIRLGICSFLHLVFLLFGHN